MPRLDHQGHEKCLQRRKGRQEHAHRHKFQTSAVDRQTHECWIQKAEARNMHVYAVCKRQKPKSREDRDGVGKGVAKCLCDLFPFHLRSFPVWGVELSAFPTTTLYDSPAALVNGRNHGLRRRCSALSCHLSRLFCISVRRSAHVAEKSKRTACICRPQGGAFPSVTPCLRHRFGICTFLDKMAFFT